MDTCHIVATFRLGIASNVHGLVRFRDSNGDQPEVDTLSSPDSRVTMPAASVNGKGAPVKNSQDRVQEASNYILFPVAVGALFLVFLVAGALLG